jgi:hypothetical protein
LLSSFWRTENQSNQRLTLRLSLVSFAIREYPKYGVGVADT